MRKLICNKCKEELVTDDSARIQAFHEIHMAHGQDSHVTNEFTVGIEDHSDEFGEIFKEEKPIMSLVQQLDAQDEKDRTEFLNKVAPKRMNAGYRHKRDQFEKHLLTQTVYRFQDNVTVLDFLNFVEITLKAFDDAHTKSGVGPYDTNQ